MRASVLITPASKLPRTEVLGMPSDHSYLELSDQNRDRFWSKANKTDGCWFWTSATIPNGYGVFMLNGKTVYAHRVAFVSEYGKISSSLVVDHICRNRNCVNPSHLRQISRGKNVSIGKFPLRDKTHCDHGHPLSGDNVRRTGRNIRVCKQCHKRRNKEYKKRLEQRAIDTVMEALR